MPHVCSLSRVALLLAAAMLTMSHRNMAGAQSAATQSKTMPQVGSLARGDAVLFESRTLKKTGDDITATFRTVFVKPAKAPGGEWFGSRTVVTVRCKAGTAAVKENRYYSDAKFTKVASEKIVGVPGYAAPVPGSVPAIAFKHLCPS
ncbi:MAG: hypothetical protein K2Y26_06345 [Gemmatimonadaceae bacterium]|nr:hypothetical protein [Gemmatimonadaceae bacterium]MBX9855123.1 hypothetical protein [Gemmatimonadaceae bacterium]